MIAVTAALTVKDGMEAGFVEAAQALAAAVRANEPGCRLYTFTKSRSTRGLFVVLELYDDEAAITAHRNSAHFKALSPALGACLAAPPSVTPYDVVV
jgi:quinol monooxygenase YgiN